MALGSEYPNPLYFKQDFWDLICFCADLISSPNKANITQISQTFQNINIPFDKLDISISQWAIRT